MKLQLGFLSIGWRVACVLLTPQMGYAADVFLSPRLSLHMGYENNRYSTSSSLTNTEGAAFFSATPALGLHVLSDKGSELTLGGSITRIDYLDSDFEYREGGEVHAEWFQSAAPFEGSLRVAGGYSSDAAVPEDDLRWLAVLPTLTYALPAPHWEWSAQAYLGWTDYDTRLTYDGDAQSDIAGEFSTGLHWLPTVQLTLWSTLYVEGNHSNEESSRYQGAGVGLGASYWTSPRGQLSALIRGGIRTYPEVQDESGLWLERNDTPLNAEISYTHRLAPWLDFFCSGSWQASGSDQPENDVDSWSLRVGVLFAQDYEIGSTEP